MPVKQLEGSGNSIIPTLTAATSGTYTLVSQGGVTQQMPLSLIDHNIIKNKGANTHAVIDSHISSVSNPHSVTKSQIGLGNVTNDAQVKVTDIGTTVAAPASVVNITGDITLTTTQMNGTCKFYNSAQAAITLPAATAGLTASFEIVNAGGVRFIRNGTDTFSCGGTTGLTALPADGTTYDIVAGGIYDLTCYVNGVWTVKRKGVQPEILVTLSGNQSYADGTDTTIQFDTKTGNSNKDNNNNFNTTTYTATPTIPGNYDAVLQVGVKSASVNGIMTIWFSTEGKTYWQRSAINFSGEPDTMTHFRCLRLDGNTNVLGRIRGIDSGILYKGDGSTAPATFMSLIRRPD